jgi:hypothetical protein
MSIVIADLAMSTDGCAAGPDPRAGHPFGRAAEACRRRSR